MSTGRASESFEAAGAFTAQLASVAEHSSDAILTLDPTGTVISWNAGAEHIYGYRADEMIGRNAASVLAPPGGEAEREALRDRLGRGESATREMDLIRADGRTVTVSVTSSPILDARGRLLAVSSIARDVSDRKQTYRAVAESEERYRNLADTATDIITRISSATGRLEYVSPSVEDILGWTPEELVGRPYTDIVGPEVGATSQLHEILGAAGTHTRNGVRLRRRDGTWAWCDITSRAVVDPISGELAVRSSARDVTARVEAERALAASEERFRLTQLHSPIGLAVVGLDGRCLQVNPALCEILGRTEQELLELTLQEITHPDELDQTLGRLRQVLEGETSSFQLETRYVRGDGEVAWVLLSAAMVRVGGEPRHLIAQLLDFGARKRDEIERDTVATRLSATNVELVDAGRVKDHVLAVTNHELRTPLSSIVGFSDLLTTEWHDLSEAERFDFVERIHQSGLRMAKLVDDFLLAVTLASGALSIAAVTAEVRPVLQTAVARAGNPAAGIAVDCSPGLRVIADPDRLAQILTGYLTNAAEYGGGPVSIEAVEAGGFVEIRVRDHGPGVPPELLPSLFDSFGDAGRATDPTTRGTGLGLAIAKGLARAQGGDAWHEPNPPRGATFAVRIPSSP